MAYNSQTGGDFSINVSLPLNEDNVPVMNVQANTQYQMSQQVSFEGLAYIPQLPQVGFQAQLMYLDTAPTNPLCKDTSYGSVGDGNHVLGSMHRDIEVGEHIFDGAYDRFGVQTQDIDNQGTKAMVVQAGFTYVGQRATA